jgi:NADPH:quinone reductase-like Zn-dependent oxidoreductase
MTTSLELRSLLKSSGVLELSLLPVPIREPGPDEVLVEVRATPINPSDLGLLLGPADPRSAQRTGDVATLTVPEGMMRAVTPRIDQSMPVGNEGAGVVVQAGSSPATQALMGKTVAMLGGAMYSQHRTMRAADVVPLPEGTSAAEGASAFVNPLTALAMVETMRREGHTALVHTAAASNLGQMLVKLCLAENIALVNVVRSTQQAELLTGLGAKYVVNSSAPGFTRDLIAALTETGATLAFDAIGGGRLAGQILAAMEVSAVSKMTSYSRYGSPTHKQIYLYGMLDTGPTELPRSVGLAWSVSGFLLTTFLQKLPPADVARLRAKVVSELKTTFASHYSEVISLSDVLSPEVMARYAKRATGEKFLIDPCKT